MILKFFKHREDSEPADAYPVNYPDGMAVGGIEYATYNWLKMYPAGKVEIIREE